MQKRLLTALAALCLALATAAQAPTTGLVAYWPLNGNYTNSTATSISTTNNGSTATTNNAGAVNTAMSFNNPTATPSQYALHAVNSALNFSGTQNFTIAVAVYFNSPYVHNTGIYDNHLNYGGYGLWAWSAPGYTEFRFNYKNGSVGTTNAVPVGSWFHVLCMRNNGTISIYINGVLNNSATEGTQTPSYPYAGCFGGMYFNSQTPPVYNPLHGKLDELRIYNRALTATEITQTYNDWFSSALPVQLTSFTATKTNSNVLLNWQTEYEQNSSHFNIQRSTDGINYTTIGTVKAQGTTTLKSYYQYTDNTVSALTNNKTVFYRLQQVDKDNRNQISNTLSVKYDADVNALLSVLQNPAVNEVRLQVQLQQQQPVQFQIINAAGANVLSKQLTLSAGQTFTAIPINTLSAGTYYITVTAGTQKQTLSFIKQ